MRIGLVVAFVLAPAAAHAESGVARLEYAGDVCSADMVRARIVEVAGHDPFVADAAAVVVVRVAVADRGVSAQVGRIDAHGTEGGRRALVEPTCRALADSIAVVVAMSLAASDAPAAPPASDAEPIPTELIPAVRAAIVPAPPPGVAFDVLAGGSANSRLVAAAFVGARIRRGSLSFALELSRDAVQEVAAGTGQVEVARRGASVVPCAAVGPLDTCATLSVGWVEGHASGIIAASRAYEPFVAVGARVAFERAIIGRFALRADVELRGFVTTDRFLVGTMAAWTSPRAEVLGGLAALARFP